MNLKKFYTGKTIGFVVVIVLVATFYGGVVYGRKQIPTRGTQIFNQNNTGGARGIKNMGIQGGITAGEIISKDEKSLTIKYSNGNSESKTGGSKIIFLGENTVVTKMATGSLNDLSIGTFVSITGGANTDGSLTAQSIQIRPNMPQGAKVQ